MPVRRPQSSSETDTNPLGKKPGVSVDVAIHSTWHGPSELGAVSVVVHLEIGRSNLFGEHLNIAAATALSSLYATHGTPYTPRFKKVKPSTPARFIVADKPKNRPLDGAVGEVTMSADRAREIVAFDSVRWLVHVPHPNRPSPGGREKPGFNGSHQRRIPFWSKRRRMPYTSVRFRRCVAAVMFASHDPGRLKRAGGVYARWPMHDESFANAWKA